MKQGDLERAIETAEEIERRCEHLHARIELLLAIPTFRGDSRYTTVDGKRVLLRPLTDGEDGATVELPRKKESFNHEQWSSGSSDTNCD